MRDTVQNYSIGTFIWGSPIVFFVWGLPYSSNRHVTPVSVRGRKGLTCSIRAPPCPRFDTLRQSVSNRAQLFLAVYANLKLIGVASRLHHVTITTSRNASIVGRAYFRLYTHAQEQDARVLWTCCRVAQPCFSSLLGVHVATLRQVDL